MKKKMNIVLIVAFCLLVTLIGKFSYDAKVEKTQVELKAYAKVHAEEEKKLELEEAKTKAKKRAEEKRVFEEHKGEKLVYSPMGDSLALGLHATKENKKYTSLLSEMIENKMGYDVQRADGAVDGGKGLVDLGIPELPNVLNEFPDFVTIEFGTNDSDENLDAYSTPEEFKERLEYVINNLKSNSKKPKILLVTTWNLGEKSLIYDDIIETVGKENEVPVVNIQSVWQNRTKTYGPEGYKDLFGNESDNWHPNDQGHKEIADIIFDKAYNILK
ncbi:SGNH/GDSL hydrolase family protein [Bacillus sp. ISL-57]|uniref:SGNH/GDSL hydrolase family protein n=1 Tax=Bacillus sp. ISL-57 TaxID=2819135 RepID=UPI001BE6ADD0|nr:SGNH/GDSL hydrolase family protein [Bacillus sp. ISL-57]MBT2718320.1 SGNH/GDSL hydrolase family protein [Bacillus sp. ISL-57]